MSSSAFSQHQHQHQQQHKMANVSTDSSDTEGSLKFNERPLIVDLPPVDKTGIAHMLSTKPDDELVETFMSNLRTVIESANTVQNSLSFSNKDTLNKLHKALCDKVCSLFPSLYQRKAIHRQSKNLIMNDIMNMASSIVNGCSSKEIEKIFHVETGKPAKDINLESLMLKLEEIQIFQKHQCTTMDKLVDECCSLKAENLALKVQIKEL